MQKIFICKKFKKFFFQKQTINYFFLQASVYSTPVLDSAPIICTFAAVITMVLQSCIYFKQPTNCKEKHSLVISCALFEILLHTLLALAINSSQHMQVDTGRYFHFVTTNILNLVLALIAYYCY